MQREKEENAASAEASAAKLSEDRERTAQELRELWWGPWSLVPSRGLLWLQ